MIDLSNLNIILTGATGVIGNSILKKLTNLNANIKQNVDQIIKSELFKFSSSNPPLITLGEKLL